MRVTVYHITMSLYTHSVVRAILILKNSNFSTFLLGCHFPISEGLTSISKTEKFKKRFLRIPSSWNDLRSDSRSWIRRNKKSGKNRKNKNKKCGDGGPPHKACNMTGKIFMFFFLNFFLPNFQIIPKISIFQYSRRIF